MTTDAEGGIAPVSPLSQSALSAVSATPDQSLSVIEKPRRKPPERGKAGGRTVQKNVSLTRAESIILEAKAAASGLSVASYLRASALGDAGPRARRAPTIEKELLGAAIAELNRVGNNVNQIARALNIGKDVDDDYYRAIGAKLVEVLDLMQSAYDT